MDGPLISIIVPNYNHEPFLRQRLESVFNQTYTNFEVILLDDKSTDNSLHILNEFGARSEVSVTIASEKNSGSPFKQWKRGISLAKGEYIWIAESDDYCEPSFLENLLRFNTENNNALDIIYAQSVDVDEQGNHIASRLDYTQNMEPNIWVADFVIDGDEFVRNYLKIKCVIPNASAVIFKKALADSNPFSESHLTMKMCGDWMYWLMLSKNARIGFKAKELNYFRVHSGVSRNHSDVEKKYQRCAEEKHVRLYLRSEYNVDQTSEILTLYTRWFRVNEVWRLVFPRFYTIRIQGTSLFKYVKQYFKINKPFHKLMAKMSK